MCGHLVVSTAVYRTGPCSERLPPAHWSRESDPKAGFPFPRVPSGQHGPSGVGLGKSRSQRAGNWGTPSPGPEGPTSPVKGEGLRAAAAVGYAVPGSGFRVPGSGFRVPGSGFRVPGSGFRVPGSWFRVPGSWFRVPGSGFRVPGSGFRVPGSGFLVPGSGFRVPGSGFRRSSYRLPATRLRLRLRRGKPATFFSCWPRPLPGPAWQCPGLCRSRQPKHRDRAV